MAAVDLFSASMNVFLLYLFIYFVFLLSHISEIIWYLAISVQLISLSIISFKRFIFPIVMVPENLL